MPTPPRTTSPTTGRSCSTRSHDEPILTLIGLQGDEPVGWEALGQWGDDIARIEPLAGGVANDVWSVRANGHLAVGRLGAKSDADLTPPPRNDPAHQTGAGSATPVWCG